jgi:hypothetical protein
MDRRLLAAASLVATVALGAVGRAQETIEMLPGARQQQEIEIIQAPSPQQVESVDGTGQQEVRENQVPTPAQRRASAVGKVVVGILAATVAIAASAASLLLL